MAKRRKQKRKARTSARSSRAGSGRDFDPDYSYVIQDLRRIGILTATFVSALVILSFILR
jgi:hypothetical protein